MRVVVEVHLECGNIAREQVNKLADCLDEVLINYSNEVDAESKIIGIDYNDGHLIHIYAQNMNFLEINDFDAFGKSLHDRVSANFQTAWRMSVKYKTNENETLNEDLEKLRRSFSFSRK